MALAKLNELIKIKERPEATFSLIRAIKDPIKTVGTYVFTDSIRGHFEEILEKVASGHGAGFWIQAEYGAGKTHFLSTLTCLLTCAENNVWDVVQDEEIKGFQRRFQTNRLFPVVFSLKGEGNIEVSEDNLLSVIEKQLEDALDERDERQKVEITTSDEILRWYNESSSALQQPINDFVKQKTGINSKEFDKDTLSGFIKDYCRENKIRPEISTSTKERIKHIYEQLIKIGYTGLLFVVDEFATWQRRHPRGTQGYNQDEDVLETLSWVLPKDLKLNIYTIIASAEPSLIKLRGERFKEFALFSGKNEKEFDIIVSQRVKELIKDKIPEIDQYYEFYKKEFEFLKGVDKQYFYDIFPFQSRCFEVIRKITRKPQLETYSTRAAIYYIYEVSSNNNLLSQDSLIKTSQLLVSHDLAKDLNHVFGPAYSSYQAALNGVDGIGPDENERELAEQLVKTLFLWHAASTEPIRPLTVRDLTEMTLTPSDIIQGHDLVENILVKLRDLPQIRYTKERGAIFNVTDKESTTYTQMFSNLKRKITDPLKIHEYWEKSLIFTPIETGGRKGVFSDIEYDSNTSRNVEFKKIEYPGEVILAKKWRSEYGEKIKDDLHLRVVILTKNTEVDLSEIKDPRIAVCVPSELTDAAKDEVRNYIAIILMDEDYKNKTVIDAEDARSWISIKKRDIINNLLNKQIGFFKSGRIYTQQSLGIDEKKVFSSDSLDIILRELVSPILGSAYTSQPYNSASFGRKFTGNDAKKIFEGFFMKDPKQSAVSACENYGEILCLSRFEDPKKFNPTDENKVFTIFKDRLKESNGEIQIWKLYQDLQSHPYGIIKELVTLYLLAFIRANSNVEIRLKPNHKISSSLKSNKKLTSFDIPKVDWRGKFDAGLDILEYTTEITWDNTLPCARIIIPELKSVTNPDEIKKQETFLIESLKAINEKIPQIIGNLKPLYNRFGENIETKFSILENFKTISNVISFQEFYSSILTLYPNERDADIEAFIKDFKIFNNLRILSENSTVLLAIKSYLDDSVIPEKDELSSKKVSLQSSIKLSSLLEDPKLFDMIKNDFETFKNEYSNKYRIYHRNYYSEVSDLKRNLGYVKEKVELVDRLRILSINLQPAEAVAKFGELLDRMKICPNEDPVNVEATPLCQKCKLTFEMQASTKPVEGFIGEIDKSVQLSIEKLNQMIKPIQSNDKDGKLKALIKIIDEKDSMKLSGILTEDLVEYLQELINKANIQSIQTDILEKIVREHSFIEENTLEQVVDAFRKELKAAFEKAKKSNPGKKIRIVLK